MAVQLRFPGEVGRTAIIGALVICSLIISLCLIIRGPRGLVFATAFIGLFAMHQIIWALEFYTQYRSTGTEAWAGDGIGVLLDGLTLFPLLVILVIGIVAGLVGRYRLPPLKE